MCVRVCECASAGVWCARVRILVDAGHFEDVIRIHMRYYKAHTFAHRDGQNNGGGKEEAVGCRPYSSVGGWRTMIYGGGVERYLWVKIEHTRSPANVQPKLVRVTCFRRTVGREGGGWRLGSSFYSESYVHTGLSKAHARRTHTQRQLHVVKVYYSRYSALILCCALLLLLLVGSLNGDVCT